MSGADYNEYERGHYAEIALPPRMKTYELRVVGTLDTHDLTPTSGKAIMVHGYQASMLVTQALTSTLRATLAFGTAHTGTPSKVIASFRTTAGDSLGCVCLSGLCFVGAVDEVVRLTNTTYSVGDVITRAVVYYTEV